MKKTMKAAYIENVGPPDVIRFGEVPVPTLQDGDVLVKVSAVAVDRGDTYIRSGQYSPTSPFPYILGRDLVGVVEAVGKNVSEFKPGDHVWSNSQGIHGRQGSFSEYVVVDKERLYHLPNKIDAKEAVALIHSAAAACMGLIRICKLKANEIIFINGASGNVGSALIQLAHARGAKVIAATGSDEKVKWCKKIGADLVINYNTQNVEKVVKEFAPSGVNVFWDTSQQPNLQLATSIIARQGRIVLMAGFNSNPTLPLGPFYSKECSILGFTLTNASNDELFGYSILINKCFEENRLKAKIAAVLPIAEASKAHKMLESDPNVWGKIVLTF